MKTEKFVYRYITPDGGPSEPASDYSTAIFALNAFFASLKLSGRSREADASLWTSKVLKQEQTSKNSYTATVLFTKK
jgi:hypothetical protein